MPDVTVRAARAAVRAGVEDQAARVTRLRGVLSKYAVRTQNGERVCLECGARAGVTSPVAHHPTCPLHETDTPAETAQEQIERRR